MFNPSRRPLSAQLILILIAVVLLTVVAAWFPESWFIHDQLDRQAWAQVSQGRRAAQSLYQSQQSEVMNQARLLSNLPRIRDWGEMDGSASPSGYLDTLLDGLDVDWIAICDGEGRVLVRSGEPVLDNACSVAEGATYSIWALAGSQPAPWLLAARAVEAEAGAAVERVVVGTALNDDFARMMSEQTGLEHTLFAGGMPVASSFIERASASTPAPRRLLGFIPEDRTDPSRRTFQLHNRPYYAIRFPLEETGLEAEVALDVTSIASTEQKLIYSLSVSLLLVGGAGSLLGTVLARRISRPLSRLADAAQRFKLGDLHTRVTVEPSFREMADVGQALEQARAELSRTLDDLQWQKAWVDQLLASIVEGIITLDESYRITFWSQGATQITGWSSEKVLGRSCDTVLHAIESNEPFSRMIPPPGVRRQITVAVAEDQHAILSFTCAALTSPDMRAGRLVVVFRDVTEEEAAHRLLGHFMANLTHEFRTPLTGLAAAIELLLDQAADMRQDELESLLFSLHLSTLSLHTLVDNLLESASLEAGSFRVFPQPVDLSEIVAEAARTMQPLLTKYDQRLVVEIPASLPVVSADSRRTIQVLVNLLSNASKYSPGHTEVVIRAIIQGKAVRVMVSDRGTGVPEARRAEVFRRFVHYAPQGASKPDGTGLGLWVVRAIIEAQGGEAGVDSRPEGGATFWFTLPMEEEQ